MSDTYSQIYIQIVFAVKGRDSLIRDEWKTDLFKYISGIISRKQQKPIIVNGTSNHVHAFVGLKPTMSVSDLTRDIKNNSSSFVNENHWAMGKFMWQEGYGAFSYSHSQIEQVYKYIFNQEQHHKIKTFREEYIELLKKFEVQFKIEHLFDWVEN